MSYPPLTPYELSTLRRVADSLEQESRFLHLDADCYAAQEPRPFNTVERCRALNRRAEERRNEADALRCIAERSE